MDTIYGYEPWLLTMVTNYGYYIWFLTMVSKYTKYGYYLWLLTMATNVSMVACVAHPFSRATELKLLLDLLLGL